MLIGGILKILFKNRKTTQKNFHLTIFQNLNTSFEYFFLHGHRYVPEKTCFSVLPLRYNLNLRLSYKLQRCANSEGFAMLASY